MNLLASPLIILNLVVVCLYLRGAFDTVNHAIIATKPTIMDLEAMCMNALSRIYREQFVIVTGHDSISLQLICGVPQGSILGTLLFLL